tara:strand:+ start:237 stop:443 length:207 start_codon:yes stop_codon:yes gene_type:complete
MGFEGTLLIGGFGFCFAFILGGRYLDHLKAEKAKKFFSNSVAASWIIYVGVGSVCLRQRNISSLVNAL